MAESDDILDRLGGTLRDFRTSQGMTQKEVAEEVGATPGQISGIERGTSSGSDDIRERLRALIGGGAAGAAEQSEGDDSRATDRPPSAADPDPREDPDEGDMLISGKGGKAVSVRSMGRFAKIEYNLFVMFAGKEIEYRVPDEKEGRARTVSVHQPGIADFLPAADGAAIRENAAPMAHAWAEWARTNPRVYMFLTWFSVEGGFKGVAVATGPVILTILKNHGIDPVAFLFQPMKPQQGDVFEVPVPPDYYGAQPPPPPPPSENGQPPITEDPNYNPLAEGVIPPGDIPTHPWQIGFDNIEGGRDPFS
jgi:transcriptional regulator with XRE-family HTH domain